MGTARRTRVAAALASLAAAGFVSLGIWQLERRAWKLDLVARVEARLAAAPAPAPGPAEWPDLDPSDAYRRVAASGVYDHGRETLVQAVTERGAGFWVLTPLGTEAGFTLLVNRGFVPAERRAPETRPAGLAAGPTRVTGLLRLTEPGGGFLRRNDPEAGRWYSRDVAAIADAKRLGPVAPYFVDADAAPNPGGLPVGGLTVVTFRNEHLAYALTWFGLALTAAAGAAVFVRAERRDRPA